MKFTLMDIYLFIMNYDPKLTYESFHLNCNSAGIFLFSSLRTTLISMYGNASFFILIAIGVYKMY